eukprot:scaffold108717_cov52-Phaeocystis_antarctica.AAC.2
MHTITNTQLARAANGRDRHQTYELDDPRVLDHSLVVDAIKGLHTHRLRLRGAPTLADPERALRQVDGAPSPSPKVVAGALAQSAPA